MTVKQVIAMTELYAGRAGAVKDVINRSLILTLLNVKLAKVIEEGNQGSKDYTFTTDGTTIEYDLATGVIPYRVLINGVKCDRITYNQADGVIYK